MQDLFKRPSSRDSQETPSILENFEWRFYLMNSFATQTIQELTSYIEDIKD